MSQVTHSQPLRRNCRSLIVRFLVVLFALCGFAPQLARGQTTVGDCTQAALVAALAVGDDVTFETDCTITLATPIIITNHVTLDSVGQAVTITSDSDSPGPLFIVASDASLTLVGITLTGGQSTNGGALYIQGNATVVLTECILSENQAVGTDGIAGADGANSTDGNGGNGRNGTAGGPAFGGAIYNEGDLTLETCTLTNNSATGGNGGNGGKGGNGGGSLSSGGNGGNGGNAGSAAGAAIYNLGILFITDSTISSNIVTGGNGGVGGTNGAGFPPSLAGLPGTGGAGAFGSGGGIYSLQTEEDITIMNCTFSGNQTRGGSSSAAGPASDGDGISGARGPDSLGGGLFTASGGITNCTFFRNSAAGGHGANGGPATRTLGFGGNGGNGGNGYGGGLYATGLVDVVNCTFSSCSAVGGTNGIGGGGFTHGSNGKPGKGGGGNLANAASTNTLINSIVSSNLAGGNFTNVSGSFVDGGHNLSSDNTFHFTGSSLNNTNAKLGPLADNGGPTKTMRLLATSPAIDNGDDDAAPDVDQRGVVRPIGAHKDIGAYESEFGVGVPPPPATFSIIGQVFDGTNGFAGVTVKADTNSTVTTSNGTYTITGVRANTYFVFATLPGFKFSPAVSVTVGPNATNVNFYASNRVFTISGHVFEGTNGLSGVTFQEFGSITTDSNGAFAIADLVPDTYTLTPRKIGFTYGFSPRTQTIVLIDQNVTNVNFEAGSIITSFTVLSNGTAQLAITGPAKTNRVEASTNLVDWVTIFTNRTVPFQFTDTQTGNFPIRFYRVIQGP